MAKRHSPGVKFPTLFTRGYFARFAQAIEVAFDGCKLLTAKPKVFSTGSLGWHTSEKKQMKVGDAMVWAQVSVQITVIGSSELPPDDQPNA